MIKVLFVCMGNICRSPSAEGAFWRLVQEEGLHEQIEIDSAGTHQYHVGDPADSRSIQAALDRGIDIRAHRARHVIIGDFEDYDYILAMDQKNLAILQDNCPKAHLHKVRLFLEFAPHLKRQEVPDPYYAGANAFDLVLDLVEAASVGLLSEIRSKHLIPGTLQP